MELPKKVGCSKGNFKAAEIKNKNKAPIFIQLRYLESIKI
jgi:hypothetical protein